MVKNKFFRLCLLFMYLISSACAVSPKAENVNYVLRPSPEVTEKFYFEFFEEYAHRLTLYRGDGDDAFQYVVFIVHESFGSSIGIGLTSDVDLSAPIPFEYYDLTVSVWRHSQDQYEKSGDLSIFTSTIKRYVIDVRKQDVSDVFRDIRKTTFFKDETVDLSDGICTDGTLYLMEARIEDSYNFIGRHSCDVGFSQKITLSASLLALAKRRIPEVANIIDDAEQAIISSGAK